MTFGVPWPNQPALPTLSLSLSLKPVVGDSTPKHQRTQYYMAAIEVYGLVWKPQHLNVCVVCTLSVHWSKPDMTHQLFWTKLCQRWTICSWKLLSREREACTLSYPRTCQPCADFSKSALDAFQWWNLHLSFTSGATDLLHC